MAISQRSLWRRACRRPLRGKAANALHRIAIQGDILGGAAMGVCNMLCLTGDGVQVGDHPSPSRYSTWIACRYWVSPATFAMSGVSSVGARSLRPRKYSLVQWKTRLHRPASGGLIASRKGCCRRRVHSDPVLLRHPKAEGVDYIECAASYGSTGFAFMMSGVYP